MRDREVLNFNGYPKQSLIELGLSAAALDQSITVAWERLLIRFAPNYLWLPALRDLLLVQEKLPVGAKLSAGLYLYGSIPDQSDRDRITGYCGECQVTVLFWDADLYLTRQRLGRIYADMPAAGGLGNE